ncbi:hypothetical protein B0T13DRAFT_447145 [Neurospora crassa]|nr:hypothetical protein B0T13DRAFT_447145 [Neurospora crassa]
MRYIDVCIVSCGRPVPISVIISAVLGKWSGQAASTCSPPGDWHVWLISSMRVPLCNIHLSLAVVVASISWSSSVGLASRPMVLSTKNSLVKGLGEGGSRKEDRDMGMRQSLAGDDGHMKMRGSRNLQDPFLRFWALQERLHCKENATSETFRSTTSRLPSNLFNISRINLARAPDGDVASGLVGCWWLSMWILHQKVFLSATGNGRSELRRLLS